MSSVMTCDPSQLFLEVCVLQTDTLTQGALCPVIHDRRQYLG
jgi:hypothetical protein